MKGPSSLQNDHSHKTRSVPWLLGPAPAPPAASSKQTSKRAPNSRDHLFTIQPMGSNGSPVKVRGTMRWRWVRRCDWPRSGIARRRSRSYSAAENQLSMPLQGSIPACRTSRAPVTTGNGVHFGAGGSHAKKSWGIIATDTMHSMLHSASWQCLPPRASTLHPAPMEAPPIPAAADHRWPSQRLGLQWWQGHFPPARPRAWL
jgi:hypothetical protein